MNKEGTYIAKNFLKEIKGVNLSSFENEIAYKKVFCPSCIIPILSLISPEYCTSYIKTTIYSNCINFKTIGNSTILTIE